MKLLSVVLVFLVAFVVHVDSFSSLQIRTRPLAPYGFVLAAKKKGGSTSPSGGASVKATVGTAAKGKPGDIRVKLNIDVKNVGKKNEVVFVSASMFNNLLGPQKKASRVSDADNADNIMKAEEEAKKAFEKAEELKGKIEALKEQIIERNIGPDGTLFGVVAGKHVLEHLTKSAKLDIPAKATVKEMLAIDASGAVIETCAGAETKRGGTFIARVQLNEKVDLAAFGFSVEQKAK